MKSINLLAFITCIYFSSCSGQPENKIPVAPEEWTIFNREVKYQNDVIHLNANNEDGLLWLNDTNFKNGTVELDIKGKDIRGQSFVGIAFHGIDNKNYDAIYFRPFNFESPERKFHSVQYVNMPENPWSVLRNKYPGKYENTVKPVPDPNNWFHVKIVVNFPEVKVYINEANEASLVVKQISNQKNGKIGLWVGNGSEGWFKNVSITSP